MVGVLAYGNSERPQLLPQRRAQDLLLAGLPGPDRGHPPPSGCAIGVVLGQLERAPGQPARRLRLRGVWSLLRRALANFAVTDLPGLVRIVKRKLKKIQYRPQLLTGCLTQTGLTLDTPAKP